MRFKILLRKGDINDATHEYISVIKDAVYKSYGIRDIPYIYSAKKMEKEDILLIISPQVVLINWLLFRSKQKIVYWFQGVAPEEVLFLYKGMYAKIKAILFTQVEKYILKKSRLIFFVSEKQLHHYQNKYGYKKDNYIIMPCFNKNMDESCFAASKYQRPTFVYAGSMLKWQCIEETLLLFSKIKERLPEAQLTILTADRNDAHKLLAKNHISAEVKYVPVEDLSHEMTKYKYGFLLRDRILINRVATPTKMNSYMAAGVIPIFSDVIGDFRKVFSTLKYAVACNYNQPEQLIDRILEIERDTITPDRIINEYRSFFDTYYNRNKYIDEIAERLETLPRNRTSA